MAGPLRDPATVTVGTAGSPSTLKRALIHLP